MKISNTAFLFLKKEKKNLSAVYVYWKHFLKTKIFPFPHYCCSSQHMDKIEKQTNIQINKQTNPASQSISDTVEKIKCQRSQG